MDRYPLQSAYLDGCVIWEVYFLTFSHDVSGSDRRQLWEHFIELTAGNSFSRVLVSRDAHITLNMTLCSLTFISLQGKGGYRDKIPHLVNYGFRSLCIFRDYATVAFINVTRLHFHLRLGINLTVDY